MWFERPCGFIYFVNFEWKNESMEICDMPSGFSKSSALNWARKRLSEQQWNKRREIWILETFLCYFTLHFKMYTSTRFRLNDWRPRHKIYSCMRDCLYLRLIIPSNILRRVYPTTPARAFYGVKWKRIFLFFSCQFLMPPPWQRRRARAWPILQPTAWNLCPELDSVFSLLLSLLTTYFSPSEFFLFLARLVVSLF